MRHFQPFSAIVDALKDSNLLELAEDDTAVRRRTAWEPSVDNSGAMRRSVYAKGFGEEVPSTQFDIEAYFSEFGATNEVRLRRSEEKLFKGSVFVEFETEELAKSFLEQENKPKYKDHELQIMSKKEYCDKKNDDIKAGRLKPNTTYDRGGKPYDRDRRGDGKRKRDDEDNRDWRSRRDEDRKRGFGNDRRGRGGDRHRGSGHGGGRSSGPSTDDRYVLQPPPSKQTNTNKCSGESQPSNRLHLQETPLERMPLQTREQLLRLTSRKKPPRRLENPKRSMHKPPRTRSEHERMTTVQMPPERQRRKRSTSRTSRSLPLELDLGPYVLLMQGIPGTGHHKVTVVSRLQQVLCAFLRCFRVRTMEYLPLLQVQ